MTRSMALMLALLAGSCSAGCDAGELDLESLQHGITCHVRRCASGFVCIEGECRQICNSDADCDTCCLTAGSLEEGIPNSCAPEEYCP